MRDSDKAYETILKMLLHEKLRSGEIVDEKALLAELQIGRTPLREALVRLAQEDFIQVLPHKGMIYARFDLNDLASMLNIRRELSDYLVRQVVRRASEEDISQLEKLVRGYFSENAAINRRSYMEFDIAFHKLFDGCSGEHFLCAVLAKFLMMTYIAMMPFIDDFTYDQKRVRQEYLDMVDSLRRRDTEQLTRTLISHNSLFSIQTGNP